MLRQLLAEDPAEVIGFDNNESELFFLGQRHRTRFPSIRFVLGDVRDVSALRRAMDGVEIVLHTAALKHVHLCEDSPREAIQTNVVGAQNVIDAAEDVGVRRVLFTSSDKAVNPTSVMGTSKLMGERLFTAADVRRRDSAPIFASTRFGNVLGSRGSVIPLFRRQIREGGPVTLTDPAMTRFIMTLQEAVALVMDSVFLARGGEVFVTKMPVVRIEDLAKVMVEELAPRCGRNPEEIEVEVIGTKPGEKMYEELLNEEEVRRAVELSRYFVIRSAMPPLFRESDGQYDEPVIGPVSRAYHSANERPMTVEDLRVYLHRNGLIDPERKTRPTNGGEQ
ncbi:MAG: polysaccharide biosynthesis protein [Gemmatimonadota bacterium]